jgi:hypothetical protein
MTAQNRFRNALRSLHEKPRKGVFPREVEELA